MNTAEHSSTDESNLKQELNFRNIAGIIFVLAGIILFLDRYLHTGWLPLVVMPSAGLFLYQWGIRQRHTGLLIAGGMSSGVGVGIVAAYNPAAAGLSLMAQFGYILFFFGLGCGLVVMGTALFTPRIAWWALITGGAATGLGASFLISPFRVFELVLFVALGIGLPLIIWGSSARLFGLIIPGCIVATSGIGFFQAWGFANNDNALLSTGIMLMWFALGWGLMTFFTRILFNKIAWWPLIPGGILAMVGFGLYISGDPSNALGFIGNTGSIALMIFGLYLLLMRKGINQ